MYQYLLHFLNQILLHSYTNLVQLFTTSIWFRRKSHFISQYLFINLTVKRIIKTFHFEIQFITFSIDYFFNSKLCLICFFQLFFVKVPLNFSPLKCVFTYFHGIVCLVFLITKTSSGQFEAYIFAKSLLYFRYFYIIISFKSTIFHIFFHYYQCQYICFTLHQQSSCGSICSLCIIVLINSIS